MREIEEQQYLTFMLAQETYAVGILRIKEIIEYSRLTEVPMMPGFIRGVINLRGRVVPVVDLQARFGREQTAPGRKTCIVILEAEAQEGQQEIGILVDAVSEVLEIPPGEIEPPPSFGARIRADFILGMGKVSNKLIILLNAGRILSVQEMATLTVLADTEMGRSEIEA